MLTWKPDNEGKYVFPAKRDERKQGNQGNTQNRKINHKLV